jgi:ribonuclease VapC
MVIDTSAIVAILFDEPERDHFTGLIDEAGLRLASVVGRVEAVCVIEGRKHEAGRERLDRFFRLTGAEIVGVTPELPEVAVEAFRRFGRGRHPARLSIGDCFAYALAKTTGEPLLFKGADFGRTDVVAVA